MRVETIEELKRQYTGQYVTVDGNQPDLIRWAGAIGQIKTISHNGRALVQFEGADRGWRDLDLEALCLSAPPPALPAPVCQKPGQ